jgi:hypothetical protein
MRAVLILLELAALLVFGDRCSPPQRENRNLESCLFLLQSANSSFHWGGKAATFSGLIGWSSVWMFNVEVNGVLSLGDVRAVTGNYYSELGVTPLLRRLLTPEDVNPRSGSTSRVAVIGYEFWQRRFGGASDVVGKGIGIEGQPFTIAQARAQLQSFWPEVLLATAWTETPGLRRQMFLSMGLDVAPAVR